jgi:three-Cys-motif partner protein
MPKKKSRDEFFGEITEQSEVKAEIVRKYFWRWAKIIANQVRRHGRDEIGYVDLFAGRGRYEDGTPSTPILILESAISDPLISQFLVAKFNDENPDNAKALEDEISKIPNVNHLKHKPVVRNVVVDDTLAPRFERWNVPTLFFLDPWGYKGISLKLIKALLRPWGCDCIFFFNYNRINQHLSNPIFTDNMNAFFGKERADSLRASLHGKSPEERQSIIINEMKAALAELGGKHSIEYYFKATSGKKTSHFLIFASKNPLGYDKMKEIMAAESTRAEQGVASFGFNPLDKQRSDPMFPLFTPLDDLAELLINDLAGRTVTMEEIYREHALGRNFTFKNYQDALKKLEAEGKIVTNPPSEKRVRAGKLTFGANVKVTFLPKKG